MPELRCLRTISGHAVFNQSRAQDAKIKSLAGSSYHAGSLLHHPICAVSVVCLHITFGNLDSPFFEHVQAISLVCNQQEAGLGPLAAGKHVQQTTRSFSKDHSADELLEPEVGSIVLHARSYQDMRTTLHSVACTMEVLRQAQSAFNDRICDCCYCLQWRRVESSIPVVCCMALPIVLGTAASYMHYSNPAWRKRRGHAPASELLLCFTAQCHDLKQLCPGRQVRAQCSLVLSIACKTCLMRSGCAALQTCPFGECCTQIPTILLHQGFPLVMYC